MTPLSDQEEETTISFFTEEEATSIMKTQSTEKRTAPPQNVGKEGDLVVIDTTSPHRGKTGRIVKVCKEKLGVRLIGEESRVLYYYPKSLHFLSQTEKRETAQEKGLKLNEDLPRYLEGMVRYTLKLFPGVSREDLAVELLRTLLQGGGSAST